MGCQDARQRESGLGSYMIGSFGISGVENSVSALRALVRWLLGKQVARMGGGYDHWSNLANNTEGGDKPWVLVDKSKSQVRQREKMGFNQFLTL